MMKRLLCLIFGHVEEKPDAMQDHYLMSWRPNYDYKKPGVAVLMCGRCKGIYWERMA